MGVNKMLVLNCQKMLEINCHFLLESTCRLQTIGNLFLPVVQTVLPYINGLVIA